MGLGDIVISSSPGDVIKTFALASCVGITAYCRKKHIAGMIHIVLPKSESTGISLNNPAYYAVSGVPLFIDKMLGMGCSKSELEVKIFGGASMKRSNAFNIGLRNIKQVKKSLEKIGIRYMLADVGGFISRTLYFDVATGEVKVNTLPIML